MASNVEAIEENRGITSDSEVAITEVNSLTKGNNECLIAGG